MRIAFALLLALAACGQPCLYVCGSDGDCPGGFYCTSHQCLQRCIICGSSCVSDTFHNCESCGTACSSGQKCSASKCAGACGTGLTDCSGSCYDLQNDRLNCGGCGHLCGDGETCSGGACRALLSCG
ncbi:MAG: hypothetical protein E6J88_19135 [Deltaproteobacteria bacterium]|nr:MAG: hypothetical protein E6J88_19135 [Deltaproteobacteria bacterium]